MPRRKPLGEHGAGAVSQHPLAPLLVATGGGEEGGTTVFAPRQDSLAAVESQRSSVVPEGKVREAS